MGVTTIDCGSCARGNRAVAKFIPPAVTQELTYEDATDFSAEMGRGCMKRRDTKQHPEGEKNIKAF